MPDESNITVELSESDIASELQELQVEWADLLMNDDIVIDIPQKCDLTSSEKEILAGRWFDDGVLGWKIDYPQVDQHL